MFINKEGKLFGKVSIIDVLVIVAILVVGIGFFLRFISPVARIVTTPEEIEYTLLVRSIRHTTRDAFMRADDQGRMMQLSDARTGEELGRIVSVMYEGAIQEDVLADGAFDAFPVPGRYDVFITVRVDGRWNQTGYYTFQNRALTMGSTSRIQTKYAASSGEIIEIGTVSGENTVEE